VPICEIRGEKTNLTSRLFSLLNLRKFVINEILLIMEIKNLSQYSNAEKIILAEQLWDSVSKEELNISSEVEKELDIRLKNLEEGKTELYTWDEIKAHLKSIR